jgi:hypothetical protein
MIVNVQVLNPVPTLLRATPNSLNIGSSTVVLSGTNFINGATALANGVPIPTQFNSSGQLTATVDPTVAGPFDLQVLNPNPGGAVSADVIEQVAGTPPTPLVDPSDASRFLMQATFGGSDADINNLSTIGYSAWFAQQFAIRSLSTMCKIDHSRRQFMKTASYAAVAGVSASPTLHSMRALAAMTSHAASAPTDYRALVCVYLQGGNDGHGTLIATDPDSFAAFTQARSGAQGLAYPLNSLRPITPTTSQSGRSFALNPYLTGVQNLFNAGRCALVANTGT